MKAVKVIKVDSNTIFFDNGVELSSLHAQDCCEHHELTLSDLSSDDFNGLEFDLTNDDFFKKIEGFGIELIPIKGHSVKIPGHGYNNGYYGTDLKLTLTDHKDFNKSYNITDCQIIEE